MKPISACANCVIAALAIVLVTAPSLAQAQTVAGTIEFVSGEATVRNSVGQARAASRGAAIASGESIETADSRIQMRMVDGAFISLQPRTLLQLDDYGVPGNGRVEERGLISLLRGGFRTITGAIGRINRTNYRVTTPTATIGIRGTEFAATADNGTRVNVSDGLVALCNNGGCVEIGAGQSGFAPDGQTRPVLSFAPARLPPTANNEERPFVVAERRNATGTSDALTGVGSGTSPAAPPPVIPLPSGSSGGVSAASVTSTGVFSAGLLGGTFTFNTGNTGGALLQSIDCCLASNSYTSGVPAEFGADGIIAWGRWTGGNLGTNSLVGMNYVVALNSNAVTLPNIVRGYASFASTAPVVTSGSTIVAVGIPNSVTGTLSVNFPNLTGGGSLTYALSIPVAGQIFSINGSANQYSGTAFLGTSSVINSSGTGCTPSCSPNIPFGNAIQGVITGAGADRAGANYGFISQIGQVTGAVVYK